MAVYTHITQNTLNDFMKQYPFKAVTDFQGIEQGVENTNYLITADATQYILTLFEKRVAKDDLPFYLDYMNFLYQNNITVPQPIKTKTGQILTCFGDKPAVVLSFLSGKDITLDKITAHHCAELGQFLAQLHQTSNRCDLSQTNSLSITNWPLLFKECQKASNGEFSTILSTLQSELSFLKKQWPQNLPKGLIHADLFPDNVFFEKETLSGIIDFYFSCTDFYAYDVAICLNAWCFDSKTSQFDITKSTAFLTAYQKGRPLLEHEKMAFPILCRGAALRFLLTRLYDWFHTPKDALVKPKNPDEYYQKLCFHQNITQFEEYLTL